MPISLTFLDLQDIFGLQNAIQKHNHHLYIGLDHLKWREDHRRSERRNLRKTSGDSNPDKPMVQRSNQLSL